MSAVSRDALRRYRIYLRLLFPAVLTYTIYRTFKDGGFTYLRQRFSFGLPDYSGLIWLHCASVGEINTALPLLELMEKSGHKLFVSTTTPTGKLVLLRKNHTPEQHVFLPLDYRFCIQRFLNKLQPAALLIMETELWPELVDSCTNKSIPVVLLNARLSDKTLNTFNWLRTTYRHTLSQMTQVLAKNSIEAERYTQLGLGENKIQVTGSLKFATAAPQIISARVSIESSYWLAASTHEDEELRIAKAWLEQKRSELLIIAPRHPERRSSIKKQLLTLTKNLQLRSESENLLPETKIYLLDSLGELDSFIAAAKLVFVGGSLIDHGGHNPLEAAHAGIATLVGPSTKNFQEEFAVLESSAACIRIDNESALIADVNELLDNPDKAALMGSNAKRIAREKASVDRTYLTAIEKILTKN